MPKVPLFVDLDGTLLSADVLFESFAALLRSQPWRIFLVPFWILRGRAYLKQQLASQVKLDVASLPYHLKFIDWLKVQKNGNGRRLVLATAADQAYACDIADHLQLFDRVLASDGRTNLKGRAKLRAIRQEVSGPFEYAGNSSADLVIWEQCSSAIVVGASPSFVKRVRSAVSSVQTFDLKVAKLRPYIAALRLHQWAKNVLFFVPVITAHQTGDIAGLAKTALGALLFSICCSAQYILNDIVDLEADRRHPTKRRRPFASGEASVAVGLCLVPILLMISLVGAWLFSRELVIALVMYFMCSMAYSLYLKRVMLLDLFVLAGLYTFRILVGNILIAVPYSIWLFSFAFFLFLSLGFAKRLLESRNAEAGGALHARGYIAEDLLQINLFGVSSAFLSTVIFILYLQSETAKGLYKQPEILWLLAPVYLYWLTRIWMLANRGAVSDDPVLFVLKDRLTYGVAAVVGLTMLVATVGLKVFG